jgi:enoyl-CoA hydratase
MTEAAEQEIFLEEKGRAGLIRLNRPKALNAVTHAMIQALEPFYHRCARNPDIYGIVMEAEGRAFSAGGDIRAIFAGRDNLAAMDRFYADEYQHNWTLECFRKPHVALIDGVVMGGGVGISIFGTHRVGGANLRFAMPETGIGFFPDIGGGWFLPRMPGEIGIYLGLTGTIIGIADAHYAGVVTHCVDAASFPAIKAAMMEAEPIDAVLDELHKHPGESALERRRAPIDRIFSASSVEEILARLASETSDRAWAEETRATLLKRCPLSLKVAFEQLRRGKNYRSLKEALIVEYRLATRFLRMPDFYEGVRALLIDKDNNPRWSPATLGEVSDEMVSALFEPLPEGDLRLTDYWMI